MRAFLYAMFICQLVATASPQQNRSLAVAARNGTVTSVVDPIHVPPTLSELITLSQLVIIARCQAEMPSRFFVKGDARSDVVTDRIVRVENVLKGSVVPASLIAIEELGGSISKYDGVHSLKQEIIHQRPLLPEHRYVLFLRPTSQILSDSFDGRRFSVTGIWAGSFELVNGQVSVSGAAQAGIRQLNGLTEADVLTRVRDAVAAESH